MARSRKKSSGEGWTLVRECPVCRRAESDCVCPKRGDEKGGPVVRIRLEKRRGKPLTVLACSGIDDERMRAWLRELKSACAAGGSIDGLELALQGDHRDRVRAFLATAGVRTRG